MEELSFNPGHRFELENLHILKEDEERISVNDLVQRAVESKQIEPVISLLQQQLSTNHLLLKNIESPINRARKAMREIIDHNSYQLATNVTGLFLNGPLKIYESWVKL